MKQIKVYKVFVFIHQWSWFYLITKHVWKTKWNAYCCIECIKFIVLMVLLNVCECEDFEEIGWIPIRMFYRTCFDILWSRFFHSIFDNQGICQGNQKYFQKIPKYSWKLTTKINNIQKQAKKLCFFQKNCPKYSKKNLVGLLITDVVVWYLKQVCRALIYR